VLGKAGLQADDAEHIATHLVEANLRGVDGHGVSRLPQYVASIADGSINRRPDVRVVRRSGATALVDADGGYGFVPADLAMRTAIALAAEFGVGVAGVANSRHFGMASTYARLAADCGLVGICTTNGRPVLAPPGGRASVVSNNPFALACPREPGDPLVVDVALSEASMGQIAVAAAEGRAIPETWAFDESGQPTADPAAALASSLLAPIGGHKGFALALAFDVLAGALTDSATGRSADGHGSSGCGHLMIAIDPERLGGKERLLRRVEVLADAVYAADGSPRMPGDRSAEVFRLRRDDGVPLSSRAVDMLDGLAAELGVGGLR
jgi:LDH2 family malate/lactate/ureidoglycolate dehydrogenase